MVAANGPTHNEIDGQYSTPTDLHGQLHLCHCDTGTASLSSEAVML